MRPLAEQMAQYSAYHRDGRNRATHFVGVPVIVFSLFVAMAMARVPLGGLELSLAMLFFAVVFVYYFVLDWLLAAALLAVFLPLLYLGEMVARMTPAAAWTTFGVSFAGGWILQLVGHVFEGRRPALVDNFWQIFVAPLFLAAEAFIALGLKKDLHREVESLYPRYLPRGDAGHA